MVRVLGAALIFMTFAGCTSVRSVDVNGGETSYSDVNRGVRGKVARVTLRDGRKMDVVGVRVDAESLTWLDRKANSVESVPTRQVREVRVVSAGSGALRGLLFGVVTGAAVGGIRAAVEGDDPGNDALAVTQDEKYLLYPPAHAVYASLATTPLGAIFGTRRVYRFDGRDVLVER